MRTFRCVWKRKGDEGGEIRISLGVFEFHRIKTRSGAVRFR